MKKGDLYLIPNLLLKEANINTIPLEIVSVIREINHYVVEDEKSARYFIKKVCADKEQSHLHIEILNKHTDPLVISQYLNPCKEGFPVGIISESGCPAVADPGSDLVIIAHQLKIRIVPKIGPSSIILALMASGLNGQSFSFNGYLPIEEIQRKKAIKHFEKLAKKNNQTQLFIETPYRNNKLLNSLITNLNEKTLLCVASNLTHEQEFIKTQLVNKWKTERVHLGKKPTIFLIY